MKLEQLRNIAEQDAGVIGVASTGTDSGDVATYPTPLFWAPNTHVLASNRFAKKHKKSKTKYQENMDYTPWDKKEHSTSIAMEYIARELERRMVPYGFTITVGEESIDVLSNSGRLFEFKVIGDYLTMSEGRTNITIDNQLGVSADNPLFIALPIPRGQSSNGIWNIAEVSWWTILKYDMMMEVAPFVDYSDLEKEVVSKLGEHFILIPKEQYRGVFDHIGFYKKAFVSEPGVNDTFKESMDLEHYKAINNWGAKSVHFDPHDFHQAVNDIEKFGTKPEQRGTDLYWNDDFRIRFSSNGIGIVEVAHAGHWYAVHAVPIIPQEYQDEYQEELRDFVKTYKKPSSFSGKWNMPDLLWKVWEANASEPSYNSGIAFHRDGVWGIDYTIAGMGRSTASADEVPFVQYRLTPLQEGLEFRSEQVFRNKKMTMNISQWDIKVLFHEGFDADKVIRFIGRFTFSS